MDIGLIIGIGGIVIGGILSVYFYLKSLRDKKPCWGIRGNTLIEDYSNLYEHLKISYNDQPVQNLTVSKVVFWNDGLQTINKQDLVTVNPLRISALNDVRILDATILCANNSSSLFEVKVADDQKAALMTFDYLDKNQGAVIQVIHSGTSSLDLMIVGDVKGVRQFKLRRRPNKWVIRISKIMDNNYLMRKIARPVAFIMGCLYIGSGICTYITVTDPFKNNNWGSIVIFFIGGFIMLGMSLFLPWQISPKGLELFDKETIKG
jgi:hypothetical protein